MLDKNDLQMIQEMITTSENRMKVMMESYFDPKFNLLYENQQIMMEQLAPRSRVIWRMRSNSLNPLSARWMTRSRN